MRYTVTTVVSLASLLATAAAFAARPRAEHTWVVTSAGALDPRLEHQIEQLAALDQALVQYVHGAAATTGSRLRPGSLSIVLHEEASAESFLTALKREASQSTGGRLEPTTALAREGYILEAFYPRLSAPDRIRITASSAAGFHNALRRVPELLAVLPSDLASRLSPPAQAVRLEKNGTQAVLADFPSFTQRGIVEGFYGAPWSHQDRLDMLRFEGQHAMNVYYYAPKDDPYHRKLWREPYPPEQMKGLGELVSTAQSNFVNFCFAISPGLTMTYSSDQDFAALTKKLDEVGKLGISCFALFLDDVPQELQDSQDKAQFKTLAQAHISLINKLHDHLKSQSASNHLVVTPTTYTNEWGNRDYIKELGAGVAPGVSIVWTGPKVASPEISAAQAREWGEYLHRKPLLWDNFPVNDGRRWRLHLGPLRGRDPHLPAALEGLFSNPMNQARASLLPLATVSDYLWNSLAYDPSKSLQHAVVSQYGSNAPQLLAAYLKTYGDYWWDENVFTPLFQERRYAFEPEKIEAQIAQLDASLGPLRGRGAFAKLLPEISPFPAETRERLAKVRADQAFRRLADGKLQWREDFNLLTAARLPSAPQLDGDFSEWRAGPLYALNEPAQISRGANLWTGPAQLSARVALHWDEQFLYLGVEVTDPELYQPYFRRGIEKGDAFFVILETAFRKNFQATEPSGEEYRLFFSPGNFRDVKPSIFSDEDYLPPRARPHDYNQEIRTAWKKTTTGYSGDIAIPVSFFEGGKFSEGYEIGLSFGVQKVLGPLKPGDDEGSQQIVFTSKSDPLFRVNLVNPSSYQRLVLAGAER